MVEMSRILCPIDFSEFSEHALKYAMKLAAWYGSTLHVLHVMPPLPPSTVSPLGEAGRQLTARNLNTMIDRWSDPRVQVSADLEEGGDVAACILEQADVIDADLIVTGSHGRTGLKRALLGSVVEHLLHRSRRPVLTIPSHADTAELARPVTFRRIICAVDFSLPSLNALAHALSIAEEADAAITLLHVIEVPPELATPSLPPDADIDTVRSAEEAKRLARLTELIPEHARDYCTVQTAVLEGGASRQILRVAGEQQSDLIVVGVHGRNAIDLAVFGSNSRDVITNATCPVLIVPSAGARGALRAAS
jgi:nucleotide-binding universal stress UspA family protein